MEGKHKALFSACRHGDVLADFIRSALFLFSVSLGRLNCYFFPRSGYYSFLSNFWYY